MKQLIAALCLLFCLSCISLAQTTYDVILRNGTVIDGTGAKAYRADVAILNGFVYRVGNLKGVAAKTEIDVKGLIVAPGFINLHSHADQNAVSSALNMLTQGVTTEIINADGRSSLEIEQQLKEFASAGLAINLGAYVGFNSVWAAVVGQEDRRPSPEQIQKMRDLLTRNLEKGAWGVSAGLDYKPGYYAKRDEVIAVMQAAGSWRTNFPNHDRLMPEFNFSSLAAIGETIEIGEKSSVMPVITHMKIQGFEQGNAPKAIEMMLAAKARGHETTADIYPYLAGQTGLGALFVPGWAVEGGRQATLKRFADPVLRARIAQEIEAGIKARILTPENIFVASHQRPFVEYMKERNAGAGETMISILEKESPTAILKFGLEDDLIKLLQYPGSAISCDCGAALPSPGMHPRYFGTFPRVLGHYVREIKALTLEDAVRKMTGLPASIIGMADRGFLAAGMAADIAVFDPVTIKDFASYEQPAVPSTGIRHVMVNGKLVLRDGKATGEKPGQQLYRTAYLPSRPMHLAQARVLTVNHKDFRLKIRQSGFMSATGTGIFHDLRTGKQVRLIEPGVLQVADRWASFTARVRVAGNPEDLTALVVVDGNNAFDSGPRIRIRLSDGNLVEADLKPSQFRVEGGAGRQK